MQPFPPWVWRIRERFTRGVACTDAHLDTPIATREAVIVDRDDALPEMLTFAELAARTSRFAELLRRIGGDAGERVLIRLPNCIAYPTAFLGAMKRGAVPVPTSSQLTADEVRFLAADSGASVLAPDRSTWTAIALLLRGLP